MKPHSMPKIEPLGLTIEELLKKREDDLANLLGPLKFHELLDLIRQVPLAHRAKFILLSPYPEALVKNLHPIELFFTLKASSLDLAVELLSYAKGSQVQFFFDLDAWYKDRIKPERALSWIILLFEAGEDTVLRWLRVADWDFLIALMQKFLKVYKKPDDVDLLEAYDYLPPYTLDDVYFIEFKVEKVEYPFRRIIEIIREEMAETYFSLLESIIGEIPLEVEERAYQFRNARLEDEGLFDYYSALDIYTPLHPRALKPIGGMEAKALEGEVSDPLFLVPVLSDRELLIHQALNSISDPQTLTRLKKEIAYLATKLIISDFVVVDSLREIEEGLKKLWSSLNLGLDSLVHGEAHLAKEYLINYHLEDIFRIGQTVLRELRRNALKVLNPKESDLTLLRYLDDPYKGYLNGVLVKNLNRIKLYQPERVGTDEEYTYFSREWEVKLVWREVELVAYMAHLLRIAIGGSEVILREMLKPRLNFDLVNLTWTAIILTALSQWVLNKEFVFRAVPKSQWKTLFPILVEKKEERCFFRESLKEELWQNLITLAKTQYFVEERFITEFVENVAQKINNEFKFANPENPPDGKIQTLILLDLSQ